MKPDRPELAAQAVVAHSSVALVAARELRDAASPDERARCISIVRRRLVSALRLVVRIPADRVI